MCFKNNRNNVIRLKPIVRERQQISNTRSAHINPILHLFRVAYVNSHIHEPIKDFSNNHQIHALCSASFCCFMCALGRAADKNTYNIASRLKCKQK